jgi:hypothetical protein
MRRMKKQARLDVIIRAKSRNSLAEVRPPLGIDELRGGVTSMA